MHSTPSFMLRPIVAAAAVALTAGCMTSTASLEDVQPTSGGALDREREAVIVIGHAVTGSADSETGLADVEITWAQYDPQRDRLIFSKPKRLETLVSVRTAMPDSDDDSAAKAYSARMVESGCYILHTTRARSMSPLTAVFGPTYLSSVTVFAGSVETPGKRSHRPVAGSGAPAFCVEGGEVAYVGDYLFDASSRPARLVEHGNSFEQARTFMDESYPEYAEALVNRDVVYE